MSKAVVLNLTELLRPHIVKINRTYRLAILAIVQVAVTLFKLAQGSILMFCSEFFTVRLSTVSEILKEVVIAINVVF